MIDALASAPTLSTFCAQVREQEDTTRRHEVNAFDLELEPAGALSVKSGELEGSHELSGGALRDLARLARIPARYFEQCEPELRAISFGHRLRQLVSAKESVQLVRLGGAVDRVLNSSLLVVPRLPILETVSNSVPQDVVTRDLRVIVNHWDGQFDVSIIAPNLARAPRVNDTVAYEEYLDELPGGHGESRCRWREPRIPRLRGGGGRPRKQSPLLRFLTRLRRYGMRRSAGSKQRRGTAGTRVACLRLGQPIPKRWCRVCEFLDQREQQCRFLDEKQPAEPGAAEGNGT